MTTCLKIPSARSLDIYRLVILRHEQQQSVARAFGVTPSRVCQVITRVRNWVNVSVGDWLFPGRDDLRFCVALELEQIRLEEHAHDASAVDIAGPNFRYSRHTQPTEAQPSPTTHPDAHLTASPLNSATQPTSPSLAATPSLDTTSPSPELLNLGLHIARLLTIWKNNRKMSDSIRVPRINDD